MHNPFIRPLTETVQWFRKVSMKSPKTAPKPIRYYAQDQKAFDRLVRHGARKQDIYEGWTTSEHWSKVRLNAGEPLGVVDGFRAFGGAVAIKKAIARFHGQGAVIVDCDTGQDSKTHGVEMFDAATGPRKPTSEYARLSKDEKLDARRGAKGQMRKGDARAVWSNPRLKVFEKIKLTGWSKGALYAAFSKSGGMTGRPPNNPIK